MDNNEKDNYDPFVGYVRESSNKQKHQDFKMRKDGYKLIETTEDCMVLMCSLQKQKSQEYL